MAQLELKYLRNKEKNEIDFIIIKNKKPWFTVEAKLNAIQLDKKYQQNYFPTSLNCDSPTNVTLCSPIFFT